jgi:hypothetical protein
MVPAWRKTEMRHQINEHITVIKGDEGTVYVTRPSLITNRIHTVPIRNVDYELVVEWLSARHVDTKRRNGIANTMVQDAFPNLSDSEREFLMTGITAREWNEYMKGDDNENSR